MNRIIPIGLAIMFTLNTVAAHGDYQKCSTVFFDSDGQFNILQLVRPELSAELRTSHWIKKYLFQNALKLASPDYLNNHPNSNPEEIANQILKNLWLADFLRSPHTESSSFPTETISINFIHRNILEYGLINLIPKQEVEGLEIKPWNTRLKKQIIQLLRSRALIFLLNPLSLIKIDNIKLPDELIASIIVDGITQHQGEIESFYRQQITVDKLNIAIKGFKSIIYVICAIVSFQLYENMKEQIEEKRKEQFLKDLDNMSERLDALDQFFEESGFYKAKN
ncbi:MAG: hypothetical protein ACXVCY_06240 [Pseudobdellovibrionaceae bacterium]